MGFLIGFVRQGDQVVLQGRHVVVIVGTLVVFALVDRAFVQLREVGHGLAMVREPGRRVEHAVVGRVIAVD